VEVVKNQRFYFNNFCYVQTYVPPQKVKGKDLGTLTKQFRIGLAINIL